MRKHKAAVFPFLLYLYKPQLYFFGPGPFPLPEVVYMPRICVRERGYRYTFQAQFQPWGLPPKFLKAPQPSTKLFGNCLYALENPDFRPPAAGCSKISCSPGAIGACVFFRAGALLSWVLHSTQHHPHLPRPAACNQNIIKPPA